MPGLAARQDLAAWGGKLRLANGSLAFEELHAWHQKKNEHHTHIVLNLLHFDKKRLASDPMFDTFRTHPFRGT